MRKVININRTTHLSNEKGENLEDTIKKYREDGWSIVKVEWEFTDDDSLIEYGAGCRWRAYFAMLELEPAIDVPYAVEVYIEDQKKWLCINPGRQVCETDIEKDCARSNSKTEAQELLAFYLKYHKVDGYRIVRKPWNENKVSDLDFSK